MKNLTHLAAALAVSMTIAAVPAGAATLIVSNGVLLGASGVVVNGATYDVSFIGGSCVDVFGECDAQSDFQFTSAEEVRPFAQALLDQVLIDGPAGQFDSAPQTVNGCNDGLGSIGCFVIAPSGLTTSDSMAFAGLVNRSGTGDSATITGGALRVSDRSGETFFQVTLTSPAPVPEPACWAMMIVGFGAVGAMIRRCSKVPTTARFA